jgi:extradiol dioxygenase family protein
MASGASLFRVIVGVTDIDAAQEFYSMLLGQPGRRVSPGRHYFDLGAVIFACYDPEADGDETPQMCNPEPIYISVPNIEPFYERCANAGLIAPTVSLKRQPWGEYSFYMQDPFGNPLCFVDETTVFRGE